jgi:hypothetical protein
MLGYVELLADAHEVDRVRSGSHSRARGAAAAGRRPAWRSVIAGGIRMREIDAASAKQSCSTPAR